MKLEQIRSIIAKSIPFFIRKRIPLRISRHLYFSGTFTARLYGKKLVKLICRGYQIENEIYWRGIEGCHEGKSMQVFAEILNVVKPPVVWDIGASSGSYGMLAKSILNHTEIYFFEPIPKAIEMIHENLEINQYKANVFQLALGDFDGSGQIYLNKDQEFAYSVTVNKNLLQKNQPTDVMTISVRRADSLMKEFSIPIPSLVKLDVETYEYEVLKGFGTTPFKDCIFLIEILSNELGEKLIPFFPSEKYDFYNIDDAMSVVRKTESLEKSDFYNYLICPKKLSSQFSFGGTKEAVKN